MRGVRWAEARGDGRLSVLKLSGRQPGRGVVKGMQGAKRWGERHSPSPQGKWWLKKFPPGFGSGGKHLAG